MAKTPATRKAPAKNASARPAGRKTAVPTVAKLARPAAKAAVKPAARAAAKTAAKPAAKPAAKTTAKTTAAKPAAVKTAARAAAKRTAMAAPRRPAGQAPAVPPVPRLPLVRDSFTMPEQEYAVLAEVKQACLKAGFDIKKSELLRIGVALLGQIDVATLKNVLASLPQLKTGRPRGS